MQAIQSQVLEFSSANKDTRGEEVMLPLTVISRSNKGAGAAVTSFARNEGLLEGGVDASCML